MRFRIVLIIAIGIIFFTGQSVLAVSAQSDFGGTQTIQTNIGVHDGMGMYVRRIDAQPGQEMLVQLSFRNQSGVPLDIIGRVSLPVGLSVVSGSTRVYNQQHSDGKAASTDNLFTPQGLNLGNYAFDSDSGEGGSVTFRVIVTNDKKLIAPGVNTFSVTGQLTGYDNGIVATNTYYAHAAVDIINNVIRFDWWNAVTILIVPIILVPIFSAFFDGTIGERLRLRTQRKVAEQQKQKAKMQRGNHNG